jgi:hypothetical protein
MNETNKTNKKPLQCEKLVILAGKGLFYINSS